MRITGAIFCERRPATIMRSAWRGEGRKTSAPKRATSKREAAMDIISMAQHARPKPSGQMELLRAQFTALSSWVKIMPSSWRSLPKSSGLVSVTCLARVVSMGPLYTYFGIEAVTRQTDKISSATEVRRTQRQRRESRFLASLGMTILWLREHDASETSVDAQDDFAELLALLQVGMGGNAIVEGPNLVDDRAQAAIGNQLQHGAQFVLDAHI